MEATMVEMENELPRPKVVDSKGILKQNREFLDYFWDIAKPEREIRLKAVESLTEHLKKAEKSDELKYSLKRLVDGLSHSREDARSGYSVALAQVLSVFEEISLKSVLEQIKEKHNLQTAKKKQVRNVAFGSFFGVLALSQSTRLHKEPLVLLDCIKLLQSLAQYRDHLRDLPRKTMVDILSETSEEVFEEVLFSALQSDLTSALSSPEQLELLLVAMQRFPSVIKPAKLKKLLGTTAIINKQNLPRLVALLKASACSVKKESVLPGVAMDLLQASLREDSFPLFWQEAIINGLMSEPPGPTHYLAFRLLGAALPLLSAPQLQVVLSGDVMSRYGEHVVSAQLPDRFRFAPEMEAYVCTFLQGCVEAERQLQVVLAFTQLTHHGCPAVPSHWRVLEHMMPDAVRRYVDWLKEAFCSPQLQNCLEFSTRKQRESQEPAMTKEACVFRFRKWIVPRLTSIVENQQIKKDEDLVLGIARFILFHAFFDTKKATAEIPETQTKLSVPLDSNTRGVTSNAFYSLLQYMNVLPVLGVSIESDVPSRRRLLGVMADGSMWVSCLAQYANTLLKQDTHIRSVRTYSTEHTQAWDSMLQSVESLRKKAKKSPAPEHTAFQHLLLIVGMQIFKSPEDSVELLSDLRSSMEKAQEKKSKKKKKQAGEDSSEPHWVEVVVEILLSLLAQPSRLIRNVCKTAFNRICPHLTEPALHAILDVLDPSKDEGAVEVMDMGEKTTEEDDEEEEDEEGEEEEEDEEEEDEGQDGEEPALASDDDDDEEEDDDDDDDNSAMEEEEVDQDFRLELMKVLHGQNASVNEEEEEEELNDEEMMKLDERLEALFREQKKKREGRRDEKKRVQKEKTLVRDFRIKVLDLLEVFLSKQGSSGLVLQVVEPLLAVIEKSMTSEVEQQEQDFLRRAADIFRNQLCRGKQYCKEVEGREAELHEMLERLIGRAQKLQDGSVALYYFSAALYLVKVLRGVVKETDSTQTPATQERIMGKVDVARVTSCFRNALVSFMTRRKSPLTGDMFIDLFNRFPVLCVELVDTAVENITGAVREHQQGQACAMVLRALQSKEVKQLMSAAQWTELCQRIADQLQQSLQHTQECKNKAVHDKMVKVLDLCHLLVKTVHIQKVDVNLESLQNVLESMNSDGCLQKAGQLEDTYWSVMKLFNIQKPHVKKVKRPAELMEQEAPKKKKKGFLPESKKRKNRKKPTTLEGKQTTVSTATSGEGGGMEGGKKKKKRNKKRKEQGGEETQTPPSSKKAKVQKPRSKKQKE
ncbi:myb-binding protein 1A-like protein [Brachyhypopomus gauderio]|uniref:myb-binding protein 1A-like protein n=1 Tax=Brachyhypopomus gauderio TaxID=698409 RepID=UPI0040417C7C